MQTAKQLNIPIEYVQIIVDFYYAELKSMLSNVEHVNINVPFISRFKVKENRLIKKMAHAEKMIKSLSKSRISNVDYIYKYEQDIERYKKIHQQIKEEKNRKYIVRKLRQIYITNKIQEKYGFNTRDLET